MTADRPLRIAVADDEPDMRLFFREVLPHLGHEVVAEASTGRELVDCCRQTRPDLLITDVRMPEGDGVQAAAEVNRGGGVPVILVSAYHDADVLNRAGADHIMAYLTKPVKPVDLEAAVRLAMLRFGHFQALAREATDLRQALEDRKLIERAKGAVVKRVGVDEDEAFRLLRMWSSNHNTKLAEVARRVTAADEIFQELERV
jgi:AmiR/NasT family two-component response regulator